MRDMRFDPFGWNLRPVGESPQIRAIRSMALYGRVEFATLPPVDPALTTLLLIVLIVLITHFLGSFAAYGSSLLAAVCIAVFGFALMTLGPVSRSGMAPTQVEVPTP